MTKAQKNSKAKSHQTSSTTFERLQNEKNELRKQLGILSKKAALLSSDVADLLMSKVAERHLVPDVDLGKAWEQSLKPKLRTLCQPIEPKDWVNEGNELRIRLGRALGARVLRNFSFTEATLKKLHDVLTPNTPNNSEEEKTNPKAPAKKTTAKKTNPKMPHQKR